MVWDAGQGVDAVWVWAKREISVQIHNTKCHTCMHACTLTTGNMAHIYRRRPQPPHALRNIGEVLEELQVCEPALIVLVAKASDLRWAD